MMTITFYFEFGTMTVWAKDINKAIDVVRTISGCSANECGAYELSMWKLNLPPGITTITS